MQNLTSKLTDNKTRMKNGNKFKPISWDKKKELVTQVPFWK